MAQVAGKVRVEFMASRAGLQQVPCKPRSRASVVAAAAQKDANTGLTQRVAAAAAAAVLITQVQPAFANPPTLYAREGKYAEELAELVAKRKPLPELKDVPDVKEAAQQIAKDVPLKKIAGDIKQSTVDALPDIPNPLPALTDPPKVEAPKPFTPPVPQPEPAKPAAPKAAAPQAPAPKPAAPQAAAPAAPSTPAPAAGEAPNSGALLGVGAVVVLGAVAAVASGNNGQGADIGAAAAVVDEKAGEAEKKVEQTAGDAAAAAKANASQARDWIDAWRTKTGASVGSNNSSGSNSTSSSSAEPAATDAAAAAEANAKDARQWIENWRNKSN